MKIFDMRYLDPRESAGAGFWGAFAGTGLIGAPSRKLAVPCVITFSPPASPWVTTH
jgi:hypothetical protein